MNVVSLETIADLYARAEAIPENTISVTFDDGWLDNYTNAFPALKKYQIPACIFLPTKFINTENWFWTDLLSLSLANLRKTKASLANIGLSSIQEARISKALAADNEEEFLDCLELCILEFKKIEETSRSSIINSLVEESSTKPKKRLFLNWEEAQEMEEHGIQFGNHSHSHQMFSRLTKDEISRELEISKTHLKLNLKNPLDIFCYPEGDFSFESHKNISAQGTKTLISNKKTTNLTLDYNLLGRIGIHQDISHTAALMSCRVRLSNIF
jgi:hypothetical protein